MEGDVVVFFVGATAPHVLRKTREGDGHLLVVEAYVHGIMYGTEGPQHHEGYCSSSPQGNLAHFYSGTFSIH